MGRVIMNRVKHAIFNCHHELVITPLLLTCLYKIKLVTAIQSAFWVHWLGRQDIVPFLKSLFAYWSRTFKLVNQNWKENNLDDLRLPELLETREAVRVSIQQSQSWPACRHAAWAFWSILQDVWYFLKARTIKTYAQCLVSIRWSNNRHLLAVQWGLRERSFLVI